MKNFKKVLALVLAIATLLSFATVASAKTADFADAKDVKNVEAVDVLSYINVLEGYPADKSFKPAKNITREEAAKIIAIFANKSTDISSLYTSANPFADMKGRWGESYVAYGYRAGIIAGKNATSFVPKANVKGTEFLKMVLVVLGYDQNKEGLVGSSWAVNTLELAKVKGLMKGLDNFDANAALTRDQAAQIMLNALKAEKVVYGQTITNLVWNTKLGYWTLGNTTTAAAAVYVSPNGAQNNYAHELLAKDFGLKVEDSYDKWGRPAHTWSKGTNTIGQYLEAADASYYTAVTECQIATDLALTADKTFPVYVNGKLLTNKYEVQRLDTVSTIGAQGRQTYVYDDDRIVMIDTFLAKVTAVKDAAYDAAGHLKANSRIDLVVYDGTELGQAIAQENGSTNYGYVKGDYVLINAYTNATNSVKASGLVDGSYFEILGKSESFEGAQTVVWYNANKHTVSGTDYNDALKFILGNGTKEINTKTWFKDQYGNLIGVVDLATVYTYGVITKMWFVNDGTNGSGKALANIAYVDGNNGEVTTNQVTISSIKMDNLTYAPAYTDYNGKAMTFGQDRLGNNVLFVATNADTNAVADAADDIIDGHMFQIETLADGTVALAKVKNHTGAIKVNASYGYLDALNGKNVKVDAETLFLVGTPNEKGVYSYKGYKGINELPTFTKADILNACYTFSDSYAKYVYIRGTADTAETTDFVYIAGKTYSEVLKTTANGGFDYYELTLAVPAADGSVVTLKTRSAAVKDTLTSINNYGKLFYVTYENGFATNAVEVDASYKQYNAADPETYATVYDSHTNAAATYSEAGTMLYFGTTGVNTSKATVVIGKLEPVMKDKVIYVISNQTNQATKIYVADWEEGKNSTVTDPWKTKDGVSVNSTGKKIVISDAALTVANLGTKVTAADSTATPIGKFVVTYTATENGYTVVKTFDSSRDNVQAVVSSLLDLPSASATLEVNGVVYTVTK